MYPVFDHTLCQIVLTRFPKGGIRSCYIQLYRTNIRWESRDVLLQIITCFGS
ncbi:hypothetical protein LINPERHAP1_LOCUS10378 [Linum perenne]